jgi:hypothetical protein
MTIRQLFFTGAAAVLTYLATLSGADHAWALVIALDTASDPAYVANPTNGAWQGQNSNTTFENPPGNDNGGFGFLPWNFAGGVNSSGAVEPYFERTHFIDGVDFPTTQHNNLGAPAFGIGDAGIPYDGDYTAATRPFAQPLAVGDVFSFDIDTPTFDDSLDGGVFPALYVEFYDNANHKTLGFWTAAQPTYGLDYGWTYTDANHSAVDIPGIDSSTYTSNGSNLTLKLTSANTAHVTIGAVGLDVTLAGGVPTSLYLLLGENNSLSDDNGNPTGEHAFYFNNLKIERTNVAGDYNGDGKVDAADYTVWRDTLGSTSDLRANGNNTGSSMNVIDLADYTTWKNNFGTSGSGGGAFSTAVPETSTAALLLTGLLMLPFLLRFAKRSSIFRREHSTPTTEPLARFIVAVARAL